MKTPELQTSVEGHSLDPLGEPINSSGLCAKHLKEQQASALPEISSTDWLGALRRHIANMKAKVTLTRMEIKELRAKADAIEGEAIDLELLIDKAERP